jgi:hypothetical protein
VNKGRLLNAVKALRESTRPDLFTMDRYVYDWSYMERCGGENLCGTPGCVLGHYASRRDLQDFLLIDSRYFLRYAKYEYRSVIFDDRPVCNHFDITEDEADLLFGPRGCNNARTSIEAADFIEEFVRRKEGNHEVP